MSEIIANAAVIAEQIILSRSAQYRYGILPKLFLATTLVVLGPLETIRKVALF